MPDKRDLKLVDISVHGPETRKSIETNDFLTYLVSCASLKYTRQKRNAPLRTVHLSGRSHVIGQFSLYQCKGMPGTAASHVFCNQASKLC